MVVLDAFYVPVPKLIDFNFIALWFTTVVSFFTLSSRALSYNSLAELLLSLLCKLTRKKNIPKQKLY